MDPQRHAVRRSSGAFLRRQALRHEKHADALRAGGRVGQTREHEVDDVVGEIVLAGRDEDLRAGDEIRTVARGDGARANQAEVGAGVRLGEAHRARPRAVDELRQEALLELFVAPPLERAHGAVREQRIHAEREVGRAQHLVEHDAGYVRQPLTAVIGRRDHRRPAALRDTRVAVAKSARRSHGAVLVVATFGVAGLVERLQEPPRTASLLPRSQR